ncbi:nicotinate-nucleotide pyrophosphorylase (plasmid) [Legionella adelaidensis]|uniref:nicotinate-nucleotide diphosphorylase (carboxylating) n=1 Tax=Legionella adelaidensis TaxID=45056 RepID=A0A0W0R4Q8_9GAMM|nr:carboxylating nicotinate-nucleotide diphosphorylase [Legionella adelaidensis]KTC66018.1 nicotinate-nucleotide pyrophosphorylase [Legionella adelaidensis]VEH85767.1 nicotinate-nucleotide pyrophosphorylase [Legionella adelaidensis]
MRKEKKLKVPPLDIIKKDVANALNEDIGSGDVSALLLPDDLVVHAKIISREPMLMCGQPWVNCIATTFFPEIRLNWLVSEGEWLSEPMTLCSIYGSARSVLTAERSILNFLQTLSGTATLTYRYVEKIKNYKTKLLDTRKTLPGLRIAQKYAVACAGGTNHRMGLYDAFLIKENHIKACGNIKKAVKAARELHKNLLIEVEVENFSELEEAFSVQPDRILLDNFTVEMIAEAVALNNPKKTDLEASGGISLNNLEAIAKTGVDYISIGALTKSVNAIDLSLLIDE